ncbi:MAG: histidine--tRNA ligase [Eubacterium sp.]|nr:histidine--tRNA ligase [Eubacterium sp.]
MALKKKPTTGMRDILPEEMRIREYVLDMIRKTYRTYGFTQIETPAVEHIENLTGGHGGENEKLIFKILKRGQKLDLERAKSEEDLVDGGLRFDLTVPLCRFYAAHQAELSSPFKALQMGNVWRADRPQRGRFRQFMQCDIDILGEASKIAEIELISAMTTLLGKLDFSQFTIRINDRRILIGIADFCGFDKERQDEVFIILDKLDKIGIEGVKEELIESGFNDTAVEKCLDIFNDVSKTGDEAGSGIIGADDLKKLADKLGDSLEDGVSENLLSIIETVDAMRQCEFKIEFDPTLVRGMSYYTGPIFEIAMDEYGGSVGGGGRYDTMIGRFVGTDTPACGFSIGFERIAMLLMERGYQIPDEEKKYAFLIEKKCTDDQIKQVISKANELRSAGNTVTIDRLKKNKKFQKEQLAALGYDNIEEIFAD